MEHLWEMALTRALDLFLPARCVACGEADRIICVACEEAFAGAVAIVRPATPDSPPVIALGSYDGRLRSTILAAKFRSGRFVARRLGVWLAPKLMRPFDVVVPVPLHASRLRERGYNQSAEMARGIAEMRSRPLSEAALARVRRTAPQSGLCLEDRAANVAAAFGPGKCAGLVCGARVLLVDDVVTTGATAQACMRALLACGARDVYLAVAAVRL
jgi:ComF family protein